MQGHNGYVSRPNPDRQICCTDELVTSATVQGSGWGRKGFDAFLINKINAIGYIACPVTLRREECARGARSMAAS